MENPCCVDENSTYKLSKEYHRKDYPLFYIKHMLQEEIEEEEFIAFVLYRIFENESIKGKRLLDVGSGPTVHRIASATKVFSEIILSEYAEANRQELQKWLNNDPNALDWSAFIAMTARLEKYGNTEKGIKTIESRIRQRVKSVLPCDVFKEYLGLNPSDVGKFDVVFTSYCLECSCPTVEAYKSAIKKLEYFLVPGGALIMIVIIDSSYCIYVNDSEKLKFYDLSVSEQLVKEALEEANLDIKHWYFNKDIGEDDTTKCKGILVLSALKKID
ncbi:nicotinamide N-methyltransferase-like [Centruroides sculpturatus]|uniref:nicotinamide N-methyltransferase-like n=1 Tax=Centruroides sculpturatus TaxID=218467 RepID=UPI000C6D9492|nr:nicotinamide N-methyltransferase-like [Centruroides sculpturatus]